jgi:putative flippase GtrA
LLADKVIGQIVLICFILFALIGGLSLLVHLAVLWLCLKPVQVSFQLSQALATGVAIVGNFTLNNWLTYHDRRMADGGLYDDAEGAIAAGSGGDAGLSVAIVRMTPTPTFHEAVCGRNPTQGDTIGQVAARINPPPPKLSHV